MRMMIVLDISHVLDLKASAFQPCATAVLLKSGGKNKPCRFELEVACTHSISTTFLTGSQKAIRHYRTIVIAF
jgi:hypothetical protein